MKRFLIIMISTIVGSIVLFFSVIGIKIMKYSNSKLPSSFDNKELYCETYNIAVKKYSDKSLKGLMTVNNSTYFIQFNYNSSEGCNMIIIDKSLRNVIVEEVNKYEFNDNSMNVYINNKSFTEKLYNQMDNDVILLSFRVN